MITKFSAAHIRRNSSSLYHNMYIKCFSLFAVIEYVYAQFPAQPGCPILTQPLICPNGYTHDEQGCPICATSGKLPSKCTNIFHFISIPALLIGIVVSCRNALTISFMNNGGNIFTTLKLSFIQLFILWIYVLLKKLYNPCEFLFMSIKWYLCDLDWLYMYIFPYCLL